MSTDRRDRGDLSRYAGVGVQFAATIGVFALGGYWLDAKLETGPWLMIVGVFAGFALGLTSLIYKFSPPKEPNDDE